tara:strand:- start:209 stop:727 length:519 start_codon:yes stop_codon:yes gene_type:complete
MLEFVLNQNVPFSFIDAGCGNGWVVRSVAKDPMCRNASGIDGSEKMIFKAKKNDLDNSYYCTELMSWNPKELVDVVLSMEVLYYLKDPGKLIRQIFDYWLKPQGKFILGLDFYFENTISHDWPESCGISNMKLLPEKEWIDFFKIAGFNSIKSWRFGAKKNWAGTLIICGVK